MKKGLTFTVCVFLLLLLVTITGCGKDEVAPVFEGATDGVYAEISVKLGTLESKLDLNEGVKAVDEVDGEVTFTINKSSLNLKKVGTYTITYTATDKTGNIATATRVIKVVDQDAPSFTLAVDGKLPEGSHLQYVDFNFMDEEIIAAIDNNAEDNGNLDVTLEKGTYNKDQSGEYVVTYKVADSAGNYTTATRKITVLPSIKYIQDVIKINEKEYPVQFNDASALVDNGSGLALGIRDEIQYMTAEFYKAEVAKNATTPGYTRNAGDPYINYAVAVILDKDLKPVLVRNSTYALEACMEDNKWVVHRNSDKFNDRVSFVDSAAPNTTNSTGILGGGFKDRIPSDGYVLIVGSAGKSGSESKGKVFLLSNLLCSVYNGGGLTYDPVAEEGTALLDKAQFSFEKDQVTIYPMPDKLATPVLNVEKHVLSWDAIANAKGYELYIDGEKYNFGTEDEPVYLTTLTSFKTLDLGLAPSIENEHYTFTVKAYTKDIRVALDSEVSEELEYVMPNAEALTAPVAQLAENTLTWEAVTGAVGYEVYVNQGGSDILVATLNGETTSLDLKNNGIVAGLIYNMNLKVKAIGDGTETLDSVLSENVLYNCTMDRVITFGDGVQYPVIQTTAADYFGRRNDSTSVGYAGKAFLYLITDAINITANMNESAGFLILFRNDGSVKSMINIVNTTNQYINGEFVKVAEYTNNSYQLQHLLSQIADGDQLLIGRNTGPFVLDDTMNTLKGRDILCHYFWGAFTPETVSANQPWRAEHTIETYPSFTVKLLDPNMLESPVLTVEGTDVKWDAVENAAGYEVFINEESKGVINETSFSLLDYVTTVGETGKTAVTNTTPSNSSEVDVKVVAKAVDGKVDSEATRETFTVATTLSDGTTSLNVNYNVVNALKFDASGAYFRLDEVVSTLMTGAKFKEGITQFADSWQAKNGGVPYMPQGVLVIFDKDFKVKQIRYNFTNMCQINADGAIVTTDLTWNGTIGSSTTKGAMLKDLPNDELLLDTDYILIAHNGNARTQMQPAVQMFVNTRSADIIAKTLKPTDEAAVATKVDIVNANYQLVFTVSIK